MWERVRSRMATGEPPEETTVSDRGIVTIPAAPRRRLDIEPGDKLRWTTDGEENLSVEVVKQHYGAFDDFEPVQMGSVVLTDSKRKPRPSGRGSSDSKMPQPTCYDSSGCSTASNPASIISR